MSKIGETKKRILNSLKEKSKTLTDLSTELDLAPSTVAEHIQELSQMNAIREIDDTGRKWKYYEVNLSFVVQEQTFARRYGFAIGTIIVVLVAIAGVYFLLPKAPIVTCTPTSGYSCTGVTVSASKSLSLTVGGFSAPTHIVGMGCSYNSSEPTVFTNLDINVSSGQFASLNITCQNPPVNFNGTIGIWLNYVRNGTTISEEVASIILAKPAATSMSTTTMPTTTTPSTTIPSTTSILPASSTMPATSTTTTPATTTVTPAAPGCNAVVRLYMSTNDSCGNFKVMLNSLGQANATGVSPAVLFIYYNNILTNETQMTVGQVRSFAVAGQSLRVGVSSTFVGLYAYQTWANVTLSLGNATASTTTTPQASTTIKSYAGCGAVFVMYIGANYTCSPFTVQLSSINTFGSNTVAQFDIFVGGRLTNASTITSGGSAYYTVNRTTLKVTALSIFDGLYQSQRWANVTLSLSSTSTSTTTSSTTTTLTQANGCNMLVILYIGNNDTCGNMKVKLTALGSNTSIAPAYFAVYSGGYFINTTPTELYPGNSTILIYNNQILKITLNQTSDGLYPSQQYAKVKLNVTSYQNAGCGNTTLVYASQNDTCGSYTVSLTDVGSGGTTASVNVYNRGLLTNVSVVALNQTKQFTINGTALSIYISRINTGLYAYQKWVLLKTVQQSNLNYEFNISYVTNSQNYYVESYQANPPNYYTLIANSVAIRNANTPIHVSTNVETYNPGTTFNSILSNLEQEYGTGYTTFNVSNVGNQNIGIIGIYDGYPTATILFTASNNTYALVGVYELPNSTSASSDATNLAQKFYQQIK